MNKVMVATALAAAAAFAAGLSMATGQDENGVSFATVVAPEPAVMICGEGRLSGGAASIALPDKFLKAADGKKAVYCLVSPVDPCPGLYAALDPTGTKLEVRSDATGARFHWMVLASPKVNRKH
jgi:hypothetical protein